MTNNKYVDCNNVYTTEKFQTTTTMDNYFKDYVNVSRFLKCCQLCRNYNKTWECSPRDYDVEDYWNSFKNIKLIAIKLNYNKDFRKKSYTSEELNYIIKNTMYAERKLFKKELKELEKIYNGEYLYSGQCDLCPTCAKKVDEPCRFPDLRRSSIEAVGGNVIKTTRDFFGFDLKWIENDQKIPEYLTLVFAILY